MEQRTAEGTFEVKLSPQSAMDAPVGRLSIAKTFFGAIEGTSEGEMLAVRSAIDGSAGYVAMERVTATIEGRKGTFALQHSGTMDRGTPTLIVTVVPDSGTEGLEGLLGSMDIDPTDGEHRYTFRYRLI